MRLFHKWTQILFCVDALSLSILSLRQTVLIKFFQCDQFFNVASLQVDLGGACGLLWCKPSMKMSTALTTCFSLLLLFSSPVPDR